MSLRHLDVRFLRDMQDYYMNRYFVELPPTATFEDLFVPTFWAHHKKLKRHDIVRCVAADGSFDVDLTVVATPNGCARMAIRPNFNGLTGAAALEAAAGVTETVRPKLVPLDAEGRPVVRTQHLPATGWRVLGLNGEEVARDLKNEDEANLVMLKYLEDTKMEMPSEALLTAAKATAKDASDKAKAAAAESRAASRRRA